MDLEIKDKNRKVIPRLRDYKTTLFLGELNLTDSGKPENPPPANSIDEQILDWELNRTLPFATDLVSAGFVVGMGDKVHEAANFILSDESGATKLQKRIAIQSKDPKFCAHHKHTIEKEPQPDSKEIINYSREQVKKYRRQLRENLRNPIKLVELAREYATLGSIKKAIRTMDTAVALAPSNRYVVRSATRLYVHAEEVEKAHFILRRAPSLKFDPWLIAAEISVAALRGQTSRNIKIGKKQITDADFNPFEVSELTSALATLEMESANSRGARKLFRQALRRPTENSIAQAEWASHTITSLDINITQFDVPRNYEALASDFYQKGEWEDSVREGTKWVLDQPFAITPVLFTGTTAALLGNYQLSEEIYRFGIKANPENPIIHNNLAYVLATIDKPDEAEIELNKIDHSLMSEDEKILTTATLGLIRFRQGFYEEGRQLYLKAINTALANKDRGMALRALLYLTREELEAQTEESVLLLEFAENEAKGFTQTPELKLIMQKLHSLRFPEREPLRITPGNLNNVPKGYLKDMPKLRK